MNVSYPPDLYRRIISDVRLPLYKADTSLWRAQPSRVFRPMALLIHVQQSDLDGTATVTMYLNDAVQFDAPMPLEDLIAWPRLPSSVKTASPGDKFAIRIDGIAPSKVIGVTLVGAILDDGVAEKRSHDRSREERMDEMIELLLKDKKTDDDIERLDEIRRQNMEEWEAEKAKENEGVR